MSTNGKLLEVINLQTHFRTPEGVSKAVDGVSFDIRPGEVLGLVGESGSGKSVSSLSIMRLIQDPPGKIVGGEKNRPLLLGEHSTPIGEVIDTLNIPLTQSCVFLQ